MGFWSVPQLGDEAPTIDTLFWLDGCVPVQVWGDDAKFASGSGGRNNPETAAAIADLQNQSTVDTNTSLRRLAQAAGPKADKTGNGLPPPRGMDPGSKMVPGLTLTARGQPQKTGPEPRQGVGPELDEWRRRAIQMEIRPPVRVGVPRL